jgi:hypothetical protein
VPLPGLLTLLERLAAAGIPVAAVTNAPRANAEFSACNRQRSSRRQVWQVLSWYCWEKVGATCKPLHLLEPLGERGDLTSCGVWLATCCLDVISPTMRSAPVHRRNGGFRQVPGDRRGMLAHQASPGAVPPRGRSTCCCGMTWLTGVEKTSCDVGQGMCCGQGVGQLCRVLR